ncbi:MAG: phosphatidate cytidylyltransferase [Treponema sp.]|nr:phosphatidate cytidylyltransferase [Treponema sp.]
MSKLAQRLFIFLFGVPAVCALVLLLPQLNHLALNLTIALFSAFSAVELSAMLAQRDLRLSKAKAAILGALLPAAATVAMLTGRASVPALAFFATTAGAGWLLLSRVFSKGEKLAAFSGELVAGLCALLYPGAFLVWLVAMTGWGNSGVVIMAFLLAVFAGDSLAWALGMLFGKNNRGLVPASPNKSVAGFIGGLLGPAIVVAGAALIWPGIFAGSFARGAIVGLLTGCAAILGDLAESAIKRSCGAKDSGKMMIGRGGFLDSMDSIAMAAPVFYLCFSAFFG